MANVYEAFSLNDRTITGKTLADFTIDFCKTMAGVDVSQAGTTLTELGVGKYVLMNPNITERTVVSLYLTADNTISVSVMMDPVDGDIAKESTLVAIGIIAGTGDTTINHDYPTTDNMKVTDQYGVGIDGCNIVAYLKTDFSAGNTGALFVKGRTITGIDGKWMYPLLLQSGLTYILLFYINGYLSDNKEIAL